LQFRLQISPLQFHPAVAPLDLARAAEVRRWRDRLPLSLSLDTIGDESLADATAGGTLR